MHIAIRLDATSKIGTGHLMRCLTLADRLAKKEIEVFFITRGLPDNLRQIIIQKEYALRELPFLSESEDIIESKDAQETINILKKENPVVDWLVVDHYALGYDWELRLRPYARNIMVIDDLTNRRHDCDLFLNQNYYKDSDALYKGLIPGQCKKFIGPQFALLRNEFIAAGSNLKRDNSSVKNILVFFGGSDSTNETAKTLNAIKELNFSDIAVDVVIGVLSANKENIMQYAKGLPYARFHHNIDNIASLMAKADLAIGAGGTATWERCFLGLPSIVISVAENQNATVKNLSEEDIVWSLGYYKEVTSTDISAALKKLIDNPDILRRMSEKAKALMQNDRIPGVDVLISTLMEQKNVYQTKEG